MSMGVVGQVGRGEARRELARRELARRHLGAYCEYVSPWFQQPRHVRYVAGLLEQVELFVRSRGREGLGRLLIMEPPRHGKSELVSRHFPAWVLGRNPDCRIILCSYGADLAEKSSRALRDQVGGGRFLNVFGSSFSTKDTKDTKVEWGKEGAHAGAPVRLSEDSRSVAAWDLAAPHRGGLVAAGVGGAITGLGANLMVVDDPVKNREEAESEPARRRLWEWWTSTAYTRLEDGAAVVGMLTRWHTDDWAGKLLKQVEEEARADRWEVVVLPAIWEGDEVQFHTKDTKGTQRDTKVFNGGEAERTAETQRGAENAENLEGEGREIASLEGSQLAMTKGRDVLGRGVGEALWAEKYGVEDLERIRANVGEYDWEALYQQRPYSRSMGFFRREWFAVVERGPEPEEIVARVRAWDKAGTAKGSGGDYAVGVLLAMTRGGVVYVEDVVRGQFRPLEREEAIERAAVLDLVRVGPPTLIWHQQDPGSAGLDSAEATSRRLARLSFRAQFETVTGSKEVRAGPWSTMCQGGGVRLVRGGWNEAFIAEHEAFPRGRFDDQVDAASWGFGKLGAGTMEGRLFY